VNLRHNGLTPVWAEDGEAAQREIDAVLPDAILLDWMLPGQSGVALARRWRADPRTKAIPILMLTARGDERDKVSGLDAGADDYITNPFGMAELLARIRAALRRVTEGGPERPEIVTPWLRLDFAAHRAFVGEAHEREVHLTATEWQIVDYLARNEGRLITHRQLITAVWGPTYSPNPNLLRVHMTNIRRKLEQHPGAPTHFITDSGVGYRFENASLTVQSSAQRA
jgi:two-component system phosphate regulon response regulator PhoB